MKPDDVTSESWANDAQQREEISSRVARELSKVGTLEDEADTLLALGQVLDSAQVVALYEHLRDESQRDEAEWRDEFEEYFPEHVEALPAVGTSDDMEPVSNEPTPYDLARQLKAGGATRDAIRTELAKRGLDASAIDVLLGALGV